MKNKNCPDCSTFLEKDSAIDACTSCGLGRTRNIEYVVDDQDYSRQTPDEIDTRKLYFKRLYNTYIKHFSKGKALDVGCADSLFIDVFVNYGWDVTGIDPYRKLNIDDNGRIRRTSLEKMPREIQYDLITMVHSLEHMPDPNTALSICHDLLTDEGKVLIIVPNFSGIWASITGEEWQMRAIEHHFFHYTMRSLGNILAKNDFDVIRLRTYSGYAPSPLQMRLTLNDFYNKPFVRVWPLRSIVYRVIDKFRPVANYIVDRNMAGAEIQVLAKKH